MDIVNVRGANLTYVVKAVGVNKDGGFAEMLSVPNDLIYPLNKDIDVEVQYLQNLFHA